jgi:hypothetical protein
VFPQGLGDPSPIPPCSIQFVKPTKKTGKLPVFFYYLVPLTGIEPVRELPPEGF